MTRNADTVRSCHLYRGTYPFHYPLPHPDSNSKWQEDVDNRIKFGLSEALKLHIIRKGDTVICIQGWRGGKGHTNSLRVVVRISTNHRRFLHPPKVTFSKTPRRRSRRLHSLGVDLVQVAHVERRGELGRGLGQRLELGRSLVRLQRLGIVVLLKHDQLQALAVLAGQAVLDQCTGHLPSLCRAPRSSWRASRQQ